MIVNRIFARTLVLVAALGLVAAWVLVGVGSAQAAERPLKQILERQFGWEVNQATKGNICAVVTETCQQGAHSSQPGGFEYPVGVANGPAPEDYVYVADRSNNRIQVFTPQGAFVSMFGWEVDKTTKANVCTAASHDECQAGRTVAAGPAGEMAEPMSVAVDRSNGRLYVLDFGNNRVQELTAAGEFLLTIGGKVNKKGGNLCTKAEIAECQAGVASPTGSVEDGAFKPARERGNLLAVGPGDVLYVGDEGRVQEFEEDGAFKGAIPVSSRVEALAVDQAGAVYLIDERPPATRIRKFVSEKEVTAGGWPFNLTPKQPGARILRLFDLAVDRAGRVATTVYEEYEGGKISVVGLLLRGASAELISEFSRPEDVSGLSFGEAEVGSTGGYELYAVAEVQQQVLGYKPIPVAEATLEPQKCLLADETETDVTLNCTLNGEVNPWGVPHTDAWFEWGRTPELGKSTPLQPICEAVCDESPVPVGAVVEGVRPNESPFYYRLSATDENEPEEAEASHSPVGSFSTPIVSPLIVGEPEASFVHSSSAVIFDELNPENARTVYFFEYGPCETPTTCVGSPYPFKTAASESSNYGRIGTTAEATGLSASTVYHYRLFAESENAEKTEQRISTEGESPEELEEDEGVFTTTAAPSVRAETGASSAVTDTSALVTGTVVPDGLTVTYAIELGIYNGAGTQFGVVASGTVRPSATPVGVSRLLTGLQPGTEYAYRITAKSGFGQSTGSALTFTTSGLPAVLSTPPPLAMLPLPPGVTFAVQPPGKCRRGYTRNKHGVCTKVKPKRKARKARKRRK